MIDLLSKLNPWKRIRELEEEVEKLGAGSRYWYAKAAEAHSSLRSCHNKIEHITKERDMYKAENAEMEIVIAESQQKIIEALKNDKRGKDGRYTK